MLSRFELHRDPSGRYFFRLLSRDGLELLRGLPYFTPNHAKRVAKQVTELMAEDTRVHRNDSHGRLCFLLYDQRGEPVATSLHVRGPLALDEIIAEVREASAKAEMLDCTGKQPRKLAAF